MSEHELLLITAADCHLCARARDVLASLSLTVREVDVSSAPAVELAGAGVAAGWIRLAWTTTPLAVRSSPAL